jgi:hypothetical protein
MYNSAYVGVIPNLERKKRKKKKQKVSWYFFFIIVTCIFKLCAVCTHGKSKIHQSYHYNKVGLSVVYHEKTQRHPPTQPQHPYSSITQKYVIYIQSLLQDRQLLQETGVLHGTGQQ